jgi:hypothetical protein
MICFGVDRRRFIGIPLSTTPLIAWRAGRRTILSPAVSTSPSADCWQALAVPLREIPHTGGSPRGEDLPPRLESSLTITLDKLCAEIGSGNCSVLALCSFVQRWFGCLRKVRFSTAKSPRASNRPLCVRLHTINEHFPLDALDR